MFGCLGVWVFGCLGVWVFGCSSVLFKCSGFGVQGPKCTRASSGTKKKKKKMRKKSSTKNWCQNQPFFRAVIGQPVDEMGEIKAKEFSFNPLKEPFW